MTILLYLLSVLFGGILLLIIKRILFKKVTDTIKEQKPFELQKFKEGFANTGEAWGKRLVQELDWKTWSVRLVILSVVGGVIFGYGFFKGRGDAKVLPTGESWIMKIDSHYLHWDKDKQSMHLQVSPDPKSTDEIKIITVKDIPGLYAQLKPYGFQLKPIGVLGGGISDGRIRGEIGAGVSWFKWFNWRTDSFITNGGFYPLGITYKITQNSGIGLGGGVGFKKDENQKIIIKYSWEF